MSVQTLISKFKEKYSQKQSEKLLLLLLLTGLIVTLCLHFKDSSTVPPVNATAENDEIETDTLIPVGFELVPIEFENQNALEPLIGNFGVVNVYLASGENAKRGQLVARNVKVLRAPMNPQALSVLVPTDQAALFLSHHGSMYAVVQNKNSALAFEQRRSRRKTNFHLEEFEDSEAQNPSDQGRAL